MDLNWVKIQFHYNFCHSSSKPSLSRVCPKGVVTEISFTLSRVHLDRLNLIFLHCDRR